MPSFFVIITHVPFLSVKDNNSRQVDFEESETSNSGGIVS